MIFNTTNKNCDTYDLMIHDDIFVNAENKSYDLIISIISLFMYTNEAF